MPRHRGKAKKGSGRGSKWSGRRGKPSGDKLIMRTHPLPCGNYACEQCKGVMLAEWRKKDQDDRY